MNALRMYVKFNLGLAFLLIAALPFCHLALTDIYHRDGDVSLEWVMVQATALVLFAFVGATVFTLSRVLRLFR